MTIPEYLIAIDALFRSGRATEHSYRGDLQQLLASLCKGISVTNEPVLAEADMPVAKASAAAGAAAGSVR